MKRVTDYIKEYGTDSVDQEFASIQKIKERILNLLNPYPKDIFKWDNKDKLDFNRGRFNKHCYKLVEIVKNDILKLLDSEKK